MTYSTRRPGRRPWPMLLLSAVDHAIAEQECLRAASSPLVGRTLWLTIGRDQLDGADADVELIEHDGTYRDILGAATWATEQTSHDGRPVLLVVNSVSPFWAMLADGAQATVHDRAAVAGTRAGVGGFEVSRDLWRDRTQRWHAFVNTLRRHPGPVLVTAYADVVHLSNAQGDRTTETLVELQAEKNLARSLTGSIHWGADLAQIAIGGFDRDVWAELGRIIARDHGHPGEIYVADVWEALGLEEGDDRPPREHVATVPLSAEAERLRAIAQVRDAAAHAGVPADEVLQRWLAMHGHPISKATDLDQLERFRNALIRRATPAPHVRTEESSNV